MENLGKLIADTLEETYGSNDKIDQLEQRLYRLSDKFTPGTPDFESFAITGFIVTSTLDGLISIGDEYADEVGSALYSGTLKLLEDMLDELEGFAGGS